MTKKFFSTLLLLAMTFVFTVSLAGCGKDDVVAKSPADEGQVAGETQGQTLEGTYKTEQTSPTGLGTELTFTADGTVTDNTGDGAGTYKIEGDKLAITYQGVKVSYFFSSDGHTVILNGVEYVFVDDSDLEYEPYVSSVDDPYTGLIVGTIPSYDSKTPPSLLLSAKEYESYIRSNLQRYIDVNPNQSEEDQRKLNDARFIVESSRDDGLLLFNPPASLWKMYWTEQYGYEGLYYLDESNRIRFETDDGYIASGSEIWFDYSVSLNRILKPQETRQAIKLTPDEARASWPDDYKKYAQ